MPRAGHDMVRWQATRGSLCECRRGQGVRGGGGRGGGGRGGEYVGGEGGG